MGKDHVLLRLVKAVYLVDEQDCALAVHPKALPGLRRYLPEVGDARRHGADRAEVALRHAGYERGKRRLAGARRPPQYDGRDPVGLDASPQDSARPDDLILADELVERPRPHPRRQGRMSVELSPGAFLEQRHVTQSP